LLAVLSGRLFVLEWTHPRHWSSIIDAPFEWDYTALALTGVDLSSARLIVSKGAYDSGSKDPTTNKLLSYMAWERANLTETYDER
jgi:hypothetical protein